MHSTCTKEQFKKNLMLGTKFYCFYHFWILIKLCSEFLRKNFGTVVKKQHFTSRDDHTKNEQISRIMQKFWLFLGIRASNLRSLMGKLHARFSKLHSTCTKEQFEKSLMLEKKYYCFITFEIQSKTFGVFAEKFRHGGQKTAFHVKRWSYQEWTNLSNNAEVLIFLGIRSSTLRSLVTTSCTVVRTAFFMYKRTIQKKLDVWKEVYCFYHFWFLIKIFSEFLRKSTARWSNLLFTSTDDPSEKEEQISWITHKFFLRIIASFSRSLVWKLHARSTKLHSTCTKEQFEKNLMLGKKVYCFITFEF